MAAEQVGSIVGPEDAARFLNVSRRTLERYAAAGTVPSIKINRVKGRVYDLAALQEWLSTQSDGVE